MAETLDQIKAKLAELDTPILTDHIHPSKEAAHVEFVTKMRARAREQLQHRHDEVSAGRPDPIDALFANPPKPETAAQA